MAEVIISDLNVPSSATGFIATLMKQSPYLEKLDMSYNPGLGA